MTRRSQMAASPPMRGTEGARGSSARGRADRRPSGPARAPLFSCPRSSSALAPRERLSPGRAQAAGRARTRGRQPAKPAARVAHPTPTAALDRAPGSRSRPANLAPHDMRTAHRQRAPCRRERAAPRCAAPTPPAAAASHRAARRSPTPSRGLFGPRTPVRPAPLHSSGSPSWRVRSPEAGTPSTACVPPSSTRPAAVSARNVAWTSANGKPVSSAMSRTEDWPST